MPEDFSYGAYPSAYNDLRPFIERLDASERLALHKSMVDHCRAAGYEPDDIREQQDSKVTYQSVLQKVDLASLKFSDINNVRRPWALEILLYVVYTNCHLVQLGA